jgi:hypothetical protein
VRWASSILVTGGAAWAARGKAGKGASVGSLTCGGIREPFRFSDRALAHLQVVILAKLRRGESFTFAWTIAVAAGSGHFSVWLHPAIPLRFNYDDTRHLALNKEWVEVLARSADQAGGLVLLPEPIAVRTGHFLST